MVIEDGFAEWTEYAGNFYGTARTTIQAAHDEGDDLLFDVEVEGATRLKEVYPEALSCFLLPPSWEILEERLRDRGTETEESIRRRLERAREELEEVESFDFLLVNDQLDEIIPELEEIYRVAQKRSLGRYHELLQRLRLEAQES